MSNNNNKEFYSKVEDIFLYITCFIIVIFFGYYLSDIDKKNSIDVFSKLDEKIEKNLIMQDLSNETLKNNYFKAQLHLIHKRYEFAHKALKINSYIKYTSFLLGTLLTILGTLLIIRGIRDSGTQVEGSAADKANLKLKTSSPGMVIVIAGTLIIIFSIIKGSEVSFDDKGIAFPVSNFDGAYELPQETPKMNEPKK